MTDGPLIRDRIAEALAEMNAAWWCPWCGAVGDVMLDCFEKDRCIGCEREVPRSCQRVVSDTGFTGRHGSIWPDK